MELPIVPAKAGFQRESPGWKYECVANNNNNAQNPIGEMQKAADLSRPDHPHNFFLPLLVFLMRKKRVTPRVIESTAIWI